RRLEVLRERSLCLRLFQRILCEIPPAKTRSNQRFLWLVPTFAKACSQARAVRIANPAAVGRKDHPRWSELGLWWMQPVGTSNVSGLPSVPKLGRVCHSPVCRSDCLRWKTLGQRLLLERLLA